MWRRYNYEGFYHEYNGEWYNHNEPESKLPSTVEAAFKRDACDVQSWFYSCILFFLNIQCHDIDYPLKISSPRMFYLILLG